MNLKKTNMLSTATILANDHYVGRPMTLDFTSVASGVVKAGSPISSAGVVANTADAVGILLDDVTADRPIGTIIIHGFIDKQKAKSNSGVDIAAAVLTALPMIQLI